MFNGQRREVSEPRGEEPLNLDATDLLLLLLYAPGQKGQELEPVDGITRLQKLVFLLDRGDLTRLVADADRFLFRPYKMGPYSEDLRRAVEELVSGGIIETKRLEYVIPDDSDSAAEPYGPEEDRTRGYRKVESLSYSLSDDIGQKVRADLWEGLTSKQQKELSEFKRFFNSLTLRQLLVYTYERFPKFTGESIIKESLER